MTTKTEYSRDRKRRLRGKNRHIRFSLVHSVPNLQAADSEARKGKVRHKGVRIFDRKPLENINALSADLQNKNYHTSPGHECVRHCPCGKDRILHKLPYYPDHIVHHAQMRVIMPTLINSYFYDSAASIPGRGMHYAAKRIERFIDENKGAGRLYYAKLDFTKFYHNINQQKIERILAQKFTDSGIRYISHEIVTACNEGLGIGLFPIQPFANFYTSPLCREVMRRFNVRVFIYCDDIAIISRDKKQVWAAVNFVKDYARNVMEQPLHTNIGVQIIDEKHCLDMVGYCFYFNHTLLRKRMKNKFKRKMHRLTNPMRRYEVANAYKGWLKHCNGFNLWRNIMGMKSFKDLHIPSFEKRDPDGKRMLDGVRTSASMLEGQEITFLDIEVGVKSKFKKAAAVVQVEMNSKKYKFFTCNARLIETLEYVKKQNAFPFLGTLTHNNTTGHADYFIQ